MRYVVSSDWHADWLTLGHRRYEEVAEAVAHSVSYAIEQHVNAYVFLGDLTDPDSGGGTFRAINLAMTMAVRLARSGIRSIWIAGNHDVCEDGTGATTLDPLRALDGPFPVDVVTEPRLIGGTQEMVLCLPFAPASHGYDVATEAERLYPESGRVVVAAHLMLPGIHPGSETEDMPRGREVLFPGEQTRGAVARMNGHYHARQTHGLGDGGPDVIIPGSLARLGFGEESNEPGFLLVDTGAP